MGSPLGVVVTPSDFSLPSPQACSADHTNRASEPLWGCDLPGEPDSVQPFPDAGIADLSADAHLVITDDLPLYHRLANDRQAAINVNYLRTASW